MNFPQRQPYLSVSQLPNRGVESTTSSDEKLSWLTNLSSPSWRSHSAAYGILVREIKGGRLAACRYQYSLLRSHLCRYDLFLFSFFDPIPYLHIQPTEEHLSVFPCFISDDSTDAASAVCFPFLQVGASTPSRWKSLCCHGSSYSQRSPAEYPNSS